MPHIAADSRNSYVDRELKANLQTFMHFVQTIHSNSP